MTAVRGHRPSRAARVATHEHTPAPARTRPIRSVALESPTAPPSVETFWSCRRWYALWTWPGREWSLRNEEGESIRQNVEADMQTLGFATYVPLMVRWVSHAGARRAVERPLLPRYVFIGSNDEPEWFKVRRADFVSGVCADGPPHDLRSRPILVPVSNLIEIAGRQAAGQFDLTRGEAPPAFLAGGTVHVRSGAFATYSGTLNQDVAAAHDLAKPVEILLRIFGRETIAHIPLADIVGGD